MQKIRTKVPMISQIKFAGMQRMAGAVQNAALLRSASSVIFQWGRKAIQTMKDPKIAPRIWASIYPGTEAHGKSPAIAMATETAGFKCAPLTRATEKTATKTANAQPAVMTIQPLFCPLLRFSRTVATTPFPKMIRSAVPMNSARGGDTTDYVNQPLSSSKFYDIVSAQSPCLSREGMEIG